MNDQDFKIFQVTLLEEWMKAEKFIKNSERISNEAHIPSIKELRYGARRYFQALDEQQKNLPDNSIKTHLIEAIENCKKARHDAIDSSIAFVHGELDLLIDKAGLDVVGTTFPDFAALRIEMAKVSGIIVESRENRLIIDGNYDKILELHLEKIVDLYGRLEISRAVIVAVRRRNRRQLWGISILLSLIVGFFASVSTLYFDKRGWFDRFKPEQELTKIINQAPNKSPASGIK